MTQRTKTELTTQITTLLADNTAGDISASDVRSVFTDSKDSLVGGPASAIDNTVPRFDSTTGQLIQGSSVVIDDTDNITGVVALTTTGNIITSAYHISSVGNGLTATGTTQGDALQLADQVNVLSTVAASTGVILPAAVVGNIVYIENAGANAVQVYGNGSDTIDGVAAATGVPLTNAKRCMYICIAANTYISAQLGVVSA